MSNAVRQRRKSQRRKAGLIVLDVEVHENAFAEALINSGRLTPEEAARRAPVERETAIASGGHRRPGQTRVCVRFGVHERLTLWDADYANSMVVIGIGCYPENPTG